MSKDKSKKWVDPQDVEITDPLHKSFVDHAASGEADEDKARAAQALIDRLLLMQRGFVNASPTEKQQALDELREKQRQFDPDDPNLAGARKIINKLGAGDYAGAVQAAKANIEHREAIRQETKAKLGEAGRNTRSKNAQATKSAIIKDYLKSDMPKKQAYHHYAELYGIGWTTVRGYLMGV
jgi:hypothetical protein